SCAGPPRPSACQGARSDACSGSRAKTCTRAAPRAASSRAAVAGSLAAPTDRPHTQANTDPGVSSGATARGDLKVTRPGREYASRSSGRALATSSLSAGSTPERQVANAKSATQHDSTSYAGGDVPAALLARAAPAPGGGHAPTVVRAAPRPGRAA